MISSLLKKNKVTIPLLLLLVNFTFKLIYISFRDIALDEPFTLFYANSNIKSIIEMLYNENNPPLHFVFLHFWIKLFGLGSLSVRLPSVIFSSLTAVIIYKIGNKFFNDVIGIGAALIFTFSTMHIFFSHEARVYPLFCLLTTCSLFYYLNIIKDPLNKANYYMLLVLNILLVYSHYFGFYIVFIEGLSLLFLEQKKSIWKPLFLVMIFLTLSYIPMIIIFFHRLGTTTTYGTWVAKPGITEVYGNLNRFINDRYNTALLILLISISFIVLFKQRKLKNIFIELFQNIYFKIILLWFVVPYLFMFFISFKYPMFIDRYILYTSIPFYILIAIVLNHFTQKYSVIAISFFLLSMLITIQLNPDNNRRLKEVVEQVQKLKNNNTITLLAPEYAYMGFVYYYNINYFKDAPNTISDLNKDLIYPIKTNEDANKLLKMYSGNCIYIQAGTEFSDPNNSILNDISSKYKIHKQFPIFQIYIIHYFYN